MKSIAFIIQTLSSDLQTHIDQQLKKKVVNHDGLYIGNLYYGNRVH